MSEHWFTDEDIEAAAEAIFDKHEASFTRPPERFDDIPQPVRSWWLDTARAALSAVRPVATEPLEGVLDRDRYTAQIFGASWKTPDDGWLAVVNDRDQGRQFVGKEFEGFGPTIDAAVRAAVAAAKEAAS